MGEATDREGARLGAEGARRALLPVRLVLEPAIAAANTTVRSLALNWL